MPDTQVVNAWANTIIATFSVAAFSFSLYQFSTGQEQAVETRKVLKEMSDVLQVQSQPLLKFQGIKWIGEETVDCSTHPARGMSVEFNNASLIPVTKTSTRLELYIGDRPVGPPEFEHNPGEMILAPNSTDATIVRGSEVTDFFNRSHTDQEGMPNIRMTVVVKSLITHRMYEYKVKVQVQSLCQCPMVNIYHMGPETFSQLENSTNS